MGASDDFQTNEKTALRRYWFRGEPFVWVCGASLTAIILMAFIFLVVIVANGIGMFWPAAVNQFQLQDGSVLMGEVVDEEAGPDGRLRYQIKIGNRDLYGLDFRWVDAHAIADRSEPAEAVTIERTGYGNFYGFPAEAGPDGRQRLRQDLVTAAKVLDNIGDLEARVAGISQDIRDRQQELRKAAFAAGQDPEQVGEGDADLGRMQAEFDREVEILDAAVKSARMRTRTFRDAAGREKEIALVDIVRLTWPNSMGFGEKVGYYMTRVGELLTAEPRESNTEGGLFPAIFGTVMLVLIMSVLSFPLGVMAGIYLREYAKEGPVVRMIRIGVNNLAGIPSIVYGIFGLGFFIYGVGGGIDQLFFAERLPEPTYGTGGILWASLTLGLLTMPVVIVATEEALGMVPGDLRQNSFALGATRIQTVLRVLLPAASPGIMTGFILAMARAAGEVAPLMITGVVKLAPDLPMDGTFPFFHPERKFMHLGFHIFDISCQSPNVEAAKPMVYMTTLLLILVVMCLASTAIVWRTHMRKKFTGRAV